MKKSPWIRVIVLTCVALLSPNTSAQTEPATAPATASAASTAPAIAPPHGVTTVVWVSVDGLRGDYIDRIKPPFLTWMMAHGMYSKHMQTIFPTITFASHVAEATGMHVSQHGIPANEFYDRSTNKKYPYPSDDSLLNAEPIWKTATRQGLRVEVVDWPLGQMQKGPYASAYFNPQKFDAKIPDEDRMATLLETYAHDHGTPPLRLVMGYIEKLDSTGHKFGPDSPEVATTLNNIDGTLSHTFDQFRGAWEAKRGPDDLLYFLVTTDHGMSTVKTLVRLDFILDLPQHSDVVTWTSGPVGNVFIPTTLSKEDREKRIADYMEKLKAKPYLTAYRQEDLPPEWQFRSDTRIGDIVVVLKQWYAFKSSIPLAEYPIEKAKEPRGMHGYPVEDDPEMEGFIMAWRSDGAMAGKDLGVIQGIDFYGTVCRWLGIQPAEGTDPGSTGM